MQTSQKKRGQKARRTVKPLATDTTFIGFNTETTDQRNTFVKLCQRRHLTASVVLREMVRGYIAERS